MWAKFYGEEYHLLYEEALKRIKTKENRRYLSLNTQTIFDVENYMKRTLLTVEIVLLEANTRAEKQNTTAFLHVVGFGLGWYLKLSSTAFKVYSKLSNSIRRVANFRIKMERKYIFPGVWKVAQEQEIYFLKTFEIALRKMNKKLRYVSDIMFAYFQHRKCGDAGNGDYLGGTLTIIIRLVHLFDKRYRTTCCFFQI